MYTYTVYTSVYVCVCVTVIICIEEGRNIDLTVNTTKKKHYFNIKERRAV